MVNDLYEVLKSVATSDVYFGYLPSNKGATAVVFTVGTNKKQATFDGPPTFISTEVMLSIWGKNPLSVETESEAIIQGLEGNQITQGQTAFCNFLVEAVASAFDAENDLFQKTISLIAHHN